MLPLGCMRTIAAIFDPCLLLATTQAEARLASSAPYPSARAHFGNSVVRGLFFVRAIHCLGPVTGTTAHPRRLNRTPRKAAARLQG